MIATNVVYICWQGFPLNDDINWLIMSMTEAGLVDFWANKIINDRLLHSRMILKSRHAPHPLRWDHLEGAFFVLAIGFILSLGFFCVENCSTWWLKRKDIPTGSNNRRTWVNANRICAPCKPYMGQFSNSIGNLFELFNIQIYLLSIKFISYIHITIKSNISWIANVKWMSKAFRKEQFIGNLSIIILYFVFLYDININWSGWFPWRKYQFVFQNR